MLSLLERGGSSGKCELRLGLLTFQHTPTQQIKEDSIRNFLESPLTAGGLQEAAVVHMCRAIFVLEDDPSVCQQWGCNCSCGSNADQCWTNADHHFAGFTSKMMCTDIKGETLVHSAETQFDQPTLKFLITPPNGELKYHLSVNETLKAVRQCARLSDVSRTMPFTKTLPGCSAGSSPCS